MIDNTLIVRQLRADRQARGIGRRLVASVRRWWPNLERHLPDGPHGSFRIDRLRVDLETIRQLLAEQLRQELLALGAWAGDSAARSLSVAVKRHRLREGLADEFQPGEPDAGGGVRAARTAEFLVEPPSAFELAQIVGPAPLRLTNLFDVDRIAATVWQGIGEGKDRRAIAKDLSAKLRGDMVAARRVARTEGLRVATAMQLQTAEQLGGMIIGFRVNAVLDSRTRPEHRQRDGTIYYRDPTPGQKGFNQMPQPPMEADGRIAWNCRCMLEPVFND